MLAGPGKGSYDAAYRRRISLAGPGDSFSECTLSIGSRVCLLPLTFHRF